jgi:brefeldin A-inhibited guanine nucleotide-exchange protein
MRSGWRTMFGVFSAASKVLTGLFRDIPVHKSRRLTLWDTERIANSAFEIVTRLNRDHFAAIVHYGSFADLTVCITEFCKVSKYQKISLLAIAMLRGVIPVMLECPECSLTPGATSRDSPGEDNMIRYWFPVLFGFYDIIMNGEDLEVRRLCVPHTLYSIKC